MKRVKAGATNSRKRLVDGQDSVVQIDVGTDFPFPRTDSSYGFGDGYAEGGEAVQHGDPDVEFRDLTVEVPRHEPLTEELDAMHLPQLRQQNA
ncbi:hypothetical protein SAMN05444370_1575 [Rubrimonas cliftonensis]|uniref:Uncharacterized protein n=1 Tax=Rubrimonas cliftonensis TaxID=89524 RepID=A0A1H4GG96_9RHOB|nr:hypothetical protein SAMN05444370_1575 [Rubrimonas cliftonensis]